MAQLDSKNSIQVRNFCYWGWPNLVSGRFIRASKEVSLTVELGSSVEVERLLASLDRMRITSCFEASGDAVQLQLMSVSRLAISVGLHSNRLFFAIVFGGGRPSVLLFRRGLWKDQQI